MNDDAGRPTVYISQVVPSPSDDSFPLAAEYLEEINSLSPPIPPNYIAFEGYAAGRFATRALQLISGEITTKSLTDTIFEYPIFNLKNYLLGPFQLNRTSTFRSNSTSSDGTCTCNQGSHQVWLTFINSTYSIMNMNGFEFIFDTCGVVYEVFLLQAPSDAIRGIIMALSILCIIFVLACAAGVIIFRKTKTMTASSPIFLLVICSGALMLAITPFFTLAYAEGFLGNNVCMTWVWFLGLGYTLFFTPIVVKTWRVHRIFNNRVLSRVITIKDKELMIYVAGGVVGELAILIAWTIYSPERLLTQPVPGTVDQVLQLCTTDNGRDQPLIIAQAVFFAVQAAIGCVFAFLTRNIKYGAFKESMEILFAVYNLTFLSVILVPLHSALTYNAIPSTIIRSFGVIFLVVVSMAALFGMKFYRILTKTEKMSTSSRRSIYGSRPSGFGTSGSGTTGSTTGSSGRSGSSKSSNTSSDTTTSDSDLEAQKMQKKKTSSKKAKPAKDESSDSTESSEVSSPRKPTKSGSDAKGSGSKKTEAKRIEESQETESSSEEPIKPTKKSPKKEEKPLKKKKEEKKSQKKEEKKSEKKEEKKPEAKPKKAEMKKLDEDSISTEPSSSEDEADRPKSPKAKKPVELPPKKQAKSPKADSAPKKESKPKTPVKKPEPESSISTEESSE
jgi:hypothetical protein